MAGDLERIKMLTKCGCPVSAVDYDGRTCLHLAASVGNKMIVKQLLDNSADMNASDRWNGTALADSVREGHGHIADLLTEAGGILGLDEDTASGMLCDLARAGDTDKIRMLLAGGCLVNAAD